MGRSSKITVSFRHRLVKLIAPKLFADWLLFSGKDTVDCERPMISFLKSYFGDKPLVGCEVGVREGINALRILKTLNIERLYLIDPYLPYYEPLFPETSSFAYQEKQMLEAQKLLGAYSNKIVWLRQTSDEAVKEIGGSLDFCYLDADHKYSQMKLDVKNYLQLISKEGVVGGHDFNSGYFGLCTAVLECFSWSKLQGKGFDWWAIK